MAKNYGKKKPARSSNNVLGSVLLIGVAFFFGYVSASFYDFNHLSHWMNEHVLAASSTPTALKKATQVAALPKPKFEFYTLLANERVRNNAESAVNGSSTAAVSQPMAPNSAANQIATLPPVERAPTVVLPSEPMNLAVTQKLPSLSTNPTDARAASAVLAQQKGGYLIQVGSFKNLREAERMKAKLLMKGFDVNIATLQQQRINWYRVTIGPFVSRNEAQKVQTAFARSEHITGMIRKMDA